MTFAVCSTSNLCACCRWSKSCYSGGGGSVCLSLRSRCAPIWLPRRRCRVFLEALRGLQRRSLLEGVGNGFTLQNVLIEYLTERLVERVCEEIADGWAADSGRQPVGASVVNRSWLNRHALLKAQAAEHIRQSQSR